MAKPKSNQPGEASQSLSATGVTELDSLLRGGDITIFLN